MKTSKILEMAARAQHYAMRFCVVGNVLTLTLTLILIHTQKHIPTTSWPYTRFPFSLMFDCSMT